MYLGMWSHLGRTLLKGIVLGAVTATVLAIGYLSLLFTLALVSRPGQPVDIASLIVGYPTVVLQTVMESMLNGAIVTYLLGGVVTGALAALATVLLNSVLKLWPFTLACAACAFIVGAIYLLTFGSERSLTANILPALLFVVFAGWLGYKLRQGSMS
jgi:hypothetical protein